MLNMPLYIEKYVFSMPNIGFTHCVKKILASMHE